MHINVSVRAFVYSSIGWMSDVLDTTISPEVSEFQGAARRRCEYVLGAFGEYIDA
jgi:hypothetical protein